MRRREKGSSWLREKWKTCKFGRTANSFFGRGSKELHPRPWVSQSTLSIDAKLIGLKRGLIGTYGSSVSKCEGEKSEKRKGEEKSAKRRTSPRGLAPFVAQPTQTRAGLPSSIPLLSLEQA